VHIDYNGILFVLYYLEYISETRIMRWKIYYTYTRTLAVRTVFVNKLRRASGGCPAVCSGENSADKYGWIDGWMDR